MYSSEINTKKRNYLITTLLSFIGICAFSQTGVAVSSTPALVDYDAYEKLVKEVKEHRKSRLISLVEFKEMSSQEKVIILDTRSYTMYMGKHIKGAIHLNFSDFTQENLARIIPSPEYKILIYCNNNFDKDRVFFASKAFIPATKQGETITLALNIPTYINLYGYGYKNVYELNELINVFDPRIEFEGTSIKVKSSNSK